MPRQPQSPGEPALILQLWFTSFLCGRPSLLQGTLLSATIRQPCLIVHSSWNLRCVPQSFLQWVYFTSINIQSSNPTLFLSKEANGPVGEIKYSILVKHLFFVSLQCPYLTDWFQCSSPDLFYPSSRQLKTFLVSHSCLFPLTFSLNQYCYTED